jgi:protein tyrosine phosphatase
MGMNRTILYGQDWRERVLDDEGLTELSLVEDGLYLSGNYFDYQALTSRGIRSVMSVARECSDTKVAFTPRLGLAHFSFPDHQIMNLGMVEAALKTLRVFRKRGTTLVHCGMGISRSPTIIALYWMATGKVATYEEGIEKLKKVRPCVRPNRLVDETVLKVVERLRRAWAKPMVQVKEGRKA